MYTVKIKLGQVTHGTVMKPYQGTKWVTLYGDDGKVAKFSTKEEIDQFLQNRAKKFPNSAEILGVKLVEKD